MQRLPVTKTPKAYIGGAFVRSESNRVFPIEIQKGKTRKFFANIPRCTRKDLRNAVEAAAKAGPGWSSRTAYNRGQVLYRLAEMMESRSAEFSEAIAMTSHKSKAQAQKEVTITVDRIIYYAGWTDKFEQVLGNTNPVAAPYFNFTVPEPMGIVGIVASDHFPLLGLLSQILPVILSGNTAVALCSETDPYPSILLGELLATSDIPGGVINLLTGFRIELIPTFATHTHIRAIDIADPSKEEQIEIEKNAAGNIKRINIRHKTNWDKKEIQNLYEIENFIELKTTWHPIGA
jgi:acyl-CoA reductase-like NAD-dependent aldehyde dehydrogenase